MSRLRIFCNTYLYFKLSTAETNEHPNSEHPVLNGKTDDDAKAHITNIYIYVYCIYKYSYKYGIYVGIMYIIYWAIVQIMIRHLPDMLLPAGYPLSLLKNYNARKSSYCSWVLERLYLFNSLPARDICTWGKYVNMSFGEKILWKK